VPNSTHLSPSSDILHPCSNTLPERRGKYSAGHRGRRPARCLRKLRCSHWPESVCRGGEPECGSGNHDQLAYAECGGAGDGLRIISAADRVSAGSGSAGAVSQATNDIQRNQPAEAIARLESAAPYEFGGPPDGAVYWPIYIHGEAFVKERDGVKAAAEYQKILAHRGVDPISPLYSLARLGVGRAYALQGDTPKARAAYQDFFALWKDADPDVPVLKAAKAEYEKLK
jgi:hypothetical protein